MGTLDPADVADIVAEAFRQSREVEEKKGRDKVLADPEGITRWHQLVHDAGACSLLAH